MAEFLHLFLKPKEDASEEQIKAKINLARDWYRYSDGIYILYTTSDVEKWHERLKPFAQPGGSLFLCKFDIEVRKGWMTKDFWAWVKKNVDRND